MSRESDADIDKFHHFVIIKVLKVIKMTTPPFGGEESPGTIGQGSQQGNKLAGSDPMDSGTETIPLTDAKHRKFKIRMSKF